MRNGNGMFVDAEGNQIWFSTDLKNRPHENWFSGEIKSVEIKGCGYREWTLNAHDSWELGEAVTEFMDHFYNTEGREYSEHTIGGDGTQISDFFRLDLHAYCHREDGPAILKKCGDRLWYHYGLRHRIDGPAVERVDGSKEWWIEGKLHRTDGPAIERVNGDKQWWLNGQLHRTLDDGPAIEYMNGDKQWWVNGQLYRTKV